MQRHPALNAALPGVEAGNESSHEEDAWKMDGLPMMPKIKLSDGIQLHASFTSRPVPMHLHSRLDSSMSNIKYLFLLKERERERERERRTQMI